VQNTAGSVLSSNAVLTVRQLPYIVTQPQSNSVAYGESATMSVVATSRVDLTSATLHYQWRRNGYPIFGQASSELLIPVTRTTDAGVYTVRVSDAAGTVTSAEATLTVTGPILTLAPSTNAPNAIQLFWVTPDHSLEFSEDLESWMWYMPMNMGMPMMPMVPMSGISIPATNSVQYYRLRYGMPPVGGD
jgi:hypothetical protein